MIRDLVAILFDRYPQEIVLVSTYDETVTYANPHAVSQVVHADPDEYPVKWSDLTAAHGLGEDAYPVNRTLRTGEREHGPGPNGGWWVSSVVPCADPEGPEVFGSGHATDNLEQAFAEHGVLVVRVAIALEFARITRLQDAAHAALGDARRRQEWVGHLLGEAGTRPINPHDGDSVPLHPNASSKVIKLDDA